MKVIKIGLIYRKWNGSTVYIDWVIDTEGEEVDGRKLMQFMDDTYALDHPRQRRWWQFWRKRDEE